MPRGDGTGPMGLGPMTGRAAGFCAGYGVPGYMNTVPGRFAGGGFGWGRGFAGDGRGWRNMYYATGLPGWMRFGRGTIAPWGATSAGVSPTPQIERTFLNAQAEVLQARLDEIRKRLDELSSQESK